MIKNNNSRTLYEMLKLELAQHFMVGEWKSVKMQLDSRVIRLLKQEDFCGAIALIYFLENCVDLP